MPQKTWILDPDRGGVSIPANKKPMIEGRIRRYAEEHFACKYTRLEIRFRGAFCYIDAFTEPVAGSDWPPADWPESREQYLERMRNTPTHLCRLRYFGVLERWTWAFFAYSD